LKEAFELIQLDVMMMRRRFSFCFGGLFCFACLSEMKKVLFLASGFRRQQSFEPANLLESAQHSTESNSSNKIIHYNILTAKIKYREMIGHSSRSAVPLRFSIGIFVVYKQRTNHRLTIVLKFF
jgi:hypothetical protein